MWVPVYPIVGARITANTVTSSFYCAEGAMPRHPRNRPDHLECAHFAAINLVDESKMKRCEKYSSAPRKKTMHF